MTGGEAARFIVRVWVDPHPHEIGRLGRYDHYAVGEGAAGPAKVLIHGSFMRGTVPGTCRTGTDFGLGQERTEPCRGLAR